MKAFKAARYFSPHFVKKFKPECADLISLLNPFHLLHQQTYQSLEKNFQNMLFLQPVEISSEYSSLQFWNDNSSSVPKWSETAQISLFFSLLLVLQKECFSSVLNNSFSKRQLRTLEDYVN